MKRERHVNRQRRRERKTCGETKMERERKRERHANRPRYRDGERKRHSNKPRWSERDIQTGLRWRDKLTCKQTEMERNVEKTKKEKERDVNRPRQIERGWCIFYERERCCDRF